MWMQEAQIRQHQLNSFYLKLQESMQISEFAQSFFFTRFFFILFNLLDIPGAALTKAVASKVPFKLQTNYFSILFDKNFSDQKIPSGT